MMLRYARGGNRVKLSTPGVTRRSPTVAAMIAALVLPALALGVARSATAQGGGTIVGEVRLAGTPPPPKTVTVNKDTTVCRSEKKIADVAAGPDPVSPRERDVLAAFASGATNPAIARELGLSPNTVKQHASSIFRKLGVRNRAEAVRRADELGLLAA